MATEEEESRSVFLFACFLFVICLFILMRIIKGYLHNQVNDLKVRENQDKRGNCRGKSGQED